MYRAKLLRVAEGTQGLESLKLLRARGLPARSPKSAHHPSTTSSTYSRPMQSSFRHTLGLGTPVAQINAYRTVPGFSGPIDRA